MQTVLCGIYEILNIVNNKRYIGQSSNLNHRWTLHKYYLRKNRHFNDYLQHAWNKYGEQAFEFHIIEICPKEVLNERECYYIDLYNTTHRERGYNLKPGGSGTNPSIEARQKMSDAQKNKWTVELRQERSQKYTGQNNPFYGKKHTKETGQKIADANRRRVWSKESKNKISKSSKGRVSANLGKSTPQDVKNKISESLKGRPSPNRKPVIQLTNNDEYIEMFDSISRASLKTGIRAYNISQCCHGKQNLAGGFKWKFKEEYDI